MGHISTVGARVAEYRSKSVRPGASTWGTLTLAPGSVSVSHHGGASSKPGLRGQIGDLSARSRRRLMFALATVEWPTGAWGLMTLTYPGAYDPDPEVWRRHIEAFRSRWERKFGKVSAAWVLEFQRRGAPHWHLVVLLPPARLALLRRWVSLTWYEVVGSGDRRHLAAGTQVKEADGPRGAAGYLYQELGKKRQKELPEGVDAAGRWWGLWGLERSTVRIDLADAEFYLVRRVLRRLAALRGYRAQLARRQGLTIIDGRRGPASWATAGAIARMVATMRAGPAEVQAPPAGPA